MPVALLISFFLLKEYVKPLFYYIFSAIVIFNDPIIAVVLSLVGLFLHLRYNAFARTMVINEQFGFVSGYLRNHRGNLFVKVYKQTGEKAKDSPEFDKLLIDQHREGERLPYTWFEKRQYLADWCKAKAFND